MSVKIIIDQEVRGGEESDDSSLPVELGKEAITSRGDLSGETLRFSHDPYNDVVISTWQGIDD